MKYKVTHVKSVKVNGKIMTTKQANDYARYLYSINYNIELADAIRVATASKFEEIQ